MKEKNENDVLRSHPHHENSKHLKDDEHKELKTDFPLSEKDEVKHAEERLRKNAK